MKKVISFFLLSVYLAFVAGTLFSTAANANFIYHSSEYKGKYFGRSYDGLSYIAQQPATAKKIHKHLPFNGKTKLIRTGFVTNVINTTLVKESALRSHSAICVKPGHYCVSLYLRNCSLLI
jgi:hypothetical protein